MEPGDIRLRQHAMLDGRNLGKMNDQPARRGHRGRAGRLRRKDVHPVAEGLYRLRNEKRRKEKELL